jgi:hypothetical protein
LGLLCTFGPVPQLGHQIGLDGLGCDRRRRLALCYPNGSNATQARHAHQNA